MAQNTGAGQTFTTDNQVGRRTFIGTTTPAYPVAGDVWIDNSAGSAPNANFTTYTATGGETSVTVTYTVGFELVYLNGVKLVRGSDYVATNGTSITGLTALVASDIVEVVSFTSFLVNGAVNLSTVTAKGDIIAATSNATVTNLPVGSDGQTLVANSSQTTGLAYTNNYAAGKNAIINGAFNVWQRGTTFASPTGYTADRWSMSVSTNPTTSSITQQTFTPGTAPVSGYEGTYFMRYLITTLGSSTDYYLGQKIEDVRTFAGQTATFSFWAKSDSSRTIAVSSSQNFGSGGSGSVSTTVGSTYSLTTSWQRFTATVSFPSIAGKTVGTSSFLQIFFTASSALASGYQLDIWGVQLEAGSVATAFQTATGTLQGELTACQRYYYRQTGSSPYSRFGQGPAASSTSLGVNVFFPVTMRTYPSSTIDYANLAVYDGTNIIAVTSVSMGQAAQQSANLSIAVASGAVTNRYYDLMGNNNAAAYIGFSAEL